MPPSGWHDQTRDAGHDDLQIAVFDFFKVNPIPGWTNQNMVMELPLVLRGRSGPRIAGFVDVAVQFYQPVEGSKLARPLSCWDLFEIKPRIYSVGAVIRQVRAIQHLGETVFPEAKVRAFAIVHHSDPLARKLIDTNQIRVLSWDSDRARFIAKDEAQ